MTNSALVILLCSMVTAPPAPPAAVDLHSCNVPGLATPARCGTMQVWENRDRRAGRRIGINFVVVPRTNPGPTEEAIVYFSGGPGEAATGDAAWIATELAGARDTRDLLLVDLRGTGASNPLPCKAAKPGDLQSYLTEFYTPSDVARCARELAHRADVTWYHSAPAVDDVEEIRAALGYDKVDLFGVSYGTRSALVYLRRHPEHVRAVLMHGSVSTDLRYPLTAPEDAQLAIDGVFADCARDPGCKAAFPDLASDLRASLRRFDGGAVKALVLDARTGGMTTVTMSRDRYTEALRALAYDASSAALIPAVVHAAAAGDLGPAAEEELAWRIEFEGDSRGVHLAVTCSEDLDFITQAEADRAAEGSFMTAFRVRDQKAACAVWPHEHLDRAFLDPVTSPVPLLVMNGTRDPATALYHAQRLMRGFPNGRVVAIPGAGHGTHGLVGLDGCYRAVVTQFVRTSDAEGVDATCMSRVRRPPFPTAFPGGKVLTLQPAALARFTGRYIGGSPPVDLSVRLKDGRLHAVLPGEDLELLPVGTTRFRAASPPHILVSFAERDGSIVGLELANGGAPVERFDRE